MKKILFILFAFAFVFASCEKVQKQQVLDPNAVIKIREASGTRSSDDPDAPTWEYVVRNAGFLCSYDQKDEKEEMLASLGVSDVDRDFVNMAITMPAVSIIGHSSDGTTPLQGYFLETKGCYYTTKTGDTIAYIPTSTIREAAVKIRAAYAAGNYTEVYRLFDQAYRGIPVSGKGYAAIKAQGKH